MGSKRKSSSSKKAQYASRWLRLGGHLVEVLLFTPLGFAFYYLPDWDGIAHDWPINADVLRRASGMVLGLPFFLLFNGWFIYTRGQTIGKMVCGTVVVTTDGQQVSGNRYLFRRILPLWSISLLWFINVPLELIVSGLIGLADTLAIFRPEKNRLADDIAGTRVIMRSDLKPPQSGKVECSFVSSPLKDKVENFRDGLLDGDFQICGNSPEWIREVLLERLAILLSQSSDSTLDDEEVKLFVVSAQRYIECHSGSECSQLAKSLSKLIEQKRKAATSRRTP